MKYIGEKIKELRHNNNMTQEKLADYLCVTYQTVSKWETGITSPDLSLIVPIARLFGVTTDKLFDFNESVEDIKRAELKCRYDDTFKTGDISVRIAVAEEAIKAYPGDMDWLNKYAWDIWCNAMTIPDEVEFAAERERATGLFRKVIENCENNEIKSNAIVGIVQCLNENREHTEAKRYAELYPNTKINSDEKEFLIISCLTGEEQIIRKQQRLLNKAEDLLNNIIHGEISPEARTTAEAIINALIPDGNYQTFHHQLYMINLSKARAEIRSSEYDRAMIAMKKAREHAIAYDNIKGEYSFTAPLFNHVKNTTENWYLTGTGTLLDAFKELFDFPAYSPLKSHRDYAELIK